MNGDVDVQCNSEAPGIPSEEIIRHWALSTLQEMSKIGNSLTVRIVDETEIAEINETYRQKRGPTNVLSFPFENPPGVDAGILGDIIICAPVVNREASEQNKTPEAHWAHMVVHGILHLCGYDHIQDKEARRMEAKEVQAMGQLGFEDPYS
ncbi:MAG: rRNA maturation RNase YbeY [Gammaproteobacteria bacterium]|nr:MAG: rRNA maturation RNase YbeY [Gammaproteobacteria bacterium]